LTDITVLRQIVLDTETTGLSADHGHRIIEIGCLEVINRRITGNTLHFYLNPERDIDEGAIAVHGLTRERLADEPKFAEVCERVLEFVAGAEILIHNASFDLSFLDAELARLKRPAFATYVRGVVDTLAMGRELHPGKRNSLDALCDRYGISNSHRKLHGALLDAELLADVYLAMTRGQESLDMLQSEAAVAAADLSRGRADSVDLVVVSASDSERQAHESYLADIAKDAKGAPVWARYLAKAS
jgi:DNA polymerase III subunit epsilon